MSKAFTREEDDAVPLEEPLPPRPRDPLPITPAGLEKLRAEHTVHVVNGAGSSRAARLLKSVIDTVVATPAGRVRGGAGFGCVVEVEHEDGRRRRYVLVGPDEANPSVGQISVASPLARLLLGQPVGALLQFRKPAGEETLRIVSIDVPA